MINWLVIQLTACTCVLSFNHLHSKPRKHQKVTDLPRVLISSVLLLLSPPLLSLVAVRGNSNIREQVSVGTLHSFSLPFPAPASTSFLTYAPSPSCRMGGETYNKPTVKNIVISSHSSPAGWKTHTGVCVYIKYSNDHEQSSGKQLTANTVTTPLPR